LQWWHGFIFFPALIFGWLKQKTKTIWAGTLFHAACNLFAYWVALHY
ncbi:MAG: CPBP family glutamic-type intramembrane protease, partial [bacterium]